MKYSVLKTMIKHKRKTKNGNEELKFCTREREDDHALGLLKDTVFCETDQEKMSDYFQQVSYENEIDFFVKDLIESIGFETDEKTGEIISFFFEREEEFSEKHLLWACFDLLIKADITIKNIKQSRMELLRELIQRNRV